METYVCSCQVIAIDVLHDSRHPSHAALQVGTENATYEGPLSLHIPLSLLLDSDQSIVMDLRLPDTRGLANSRTQKVQAVLQTLSATAHGVEAQEVRGLASITRPIKI